MRRLFIVLVLPALFLACGKSSGPHLTLLSRSYHLGSFNQKNAATWEFVTGTETVDNWTTLVTLIDRPDAHTAAELDSLAEGVMTAYKSNGGRILLAKTMRKKSGVAFNYLVASFDEPAKRRFELNFVKIGLAPKNAYILVYSARASDSENHAAQELLDRHSEEIGKALETAVLPDLSALPRKVF